MIDLNYSPSSKDLICTFRLKPARGVSLRKAAEAIAAESSVGTWTAIKLNKRARAMAAKVFSIKKNLIKIAYPAELFEPGNMPQIFSSIAGNIFGMALVDSLRLEDVQWPRALRRSFPGPAFGIPGIRKLTRVRNRPLCGTIIKPKLGLSSAQHARLAFEAWVGGIDLVKDDENLTSQSFNRFQKRLRLTLRARERAESLTGERKLYMPNVTAPYKEMLARAKLAARAGCEYVMVDIITVGWSALQALRSENLAAIHAHRAMHAAFTRSPHHGISMQVIACAARLCGVDQLHIGTVVGKMAGTRAEVLASSRALTQDWGKIKPVFAVCSGGLHPGLVPYLIKLLGKDIIIQAGGAVHGHPLGPRAGATAMRQAIDATIRGIPLKSYSRKELQLAIKKWGTYKVCA